MSIVNKNDKIVFSLNQRQCGFALAGVIGALFIIFITGYFYGQKSAAEQFTYRIDQESLADQVYSSLCGLYDNKTEPETGGQADEDAEKIELAEDIEVAPGATAIESSLIQEQESINGPAYYAQLVGFGTRGAAEKCIERLAKAGYNVALEERISKNKRGVTITWYQVVTSHYGDKSGLLADVEHIKKLEKIKDVRIITA